MRCLHVLGSLDYRAGGPLRAVVDLAALSVPLGLLSEVLGFDSLCLPDNPIPSELIHSLPTKWLHTYGYAPGLRQWCRKNLGRFDIVILHGLWSYANLAVSGECRRARIPYISFPHGMLDLWPVNGQGLLKRLKKTLYWHLIEKQVLTHSCATFFTLNRELNNAKKTFRLPPLHPLIVTPYGGQAQIGANTARQAAANGHRQKIALFLGRVHPKKRPDILINAWKDARLAPEWRLIIAGPGEPTYLAHLAGMVRHHELEGSVQFAGPVSGADKESLLTGASWFLLPSEQENFGIAVLEAVFNGCAVAVSDQVYLADELPEGSEILPLRLEAWSRFMRERMIDISWRDETARRVNVQLLEKFSPESVSRAWVGKITEVLNGACFSGKQ
jgi:glycosyltransferase involved in cell wall biosynthesis